MSCTTLREVDASSSGKTQVLVLGASVVTDPEPLPLPELADVGADVGVSVGEQSVVRMQSLLRVKKHLVGAVRLAASDGKHLWDTDNCSVWRGSHIGGHREWQDLL